jgi:hypothetical protein
MKSTLTEAFNRLEETLLKNIASHIFEYEFHAKADEETLVAYYGGAYVSRDRLLNDTLQRLHSDQMKLQFLTENRNHFNTTSGNEDPQGNISYTLQRSTGTSPQPEGIDADAAEVADGEDTDHDSGSNDDAAEGSDGGDKD